jgi:hypothetical protein
MALETMPTTMVCPITILAPAPAPAVDKVKVSLEISLARRHSLDFWRRLLKEDQSEKIDPVGVAATCSSKLCVESL